MKINLVCRDREIVYNWDGFTVCRDLNVDNYRYLKLVEANALQGTNISPEK